MNVCTIAIPTLAILLATLLSHREALAIRATMRTEFGLLRFEMKQLRESIRYKP